MQTSGRPIDAERASQRYLPANRNPSGTRKRNQDLAGWDGIGLGAVLGIVVHLELTVDFWRPAAGRPRLHQPGEFVGEIAALPVQDRQPVGAFLAMFRRRIGALDLLAHVEYFKLGDADLVDQAANRLSHGYFFGRRTKASSIASIRSFRRWLSLSICRLACATWASSGTRALSSSCQSSQLVCANRLTSSPNPSFFFFSIIGTP